MRNVALNDRRCHPLPEVDLSNLIADKVALFNASRVNMALRAACVEVATIIVRQ